MSTDEWPQPNCRTIPVEWPKCKVQMRNGEVVEGYIADERTGESTVRVPSEPRKVPGAFGLQTVDYAYLDVRNEFISR